jgi:hypothetical protein
MLIPAPIAERLSLSVRSFCTLGIRFWDAARDRQVGSGLRVTGRLLGSSATPVAARRTCGGVYAFFGLPGLWEVEHPPVADQPAPTTAGPPALRDYWIEVRDDQSRFVPVGFVVELPLGERGLYLGSPGSPPEAGPAGFYLFSAPRRPMDSRLAAVRGELEDELTGGPAAHALIVLEVAGHSRAYGLSDAGGRFLVAFPYPPFESLAVGSPPVRTPPREHFWEVIVRFYYQPSAVAQDRISGLADLRGILAQAPAKVWRDDPDFASPPVPDDDIRGELRFAHPLVLRSGAGSTLVIRPGGSPP